jgi:phage portal protein BeeE
LRRIELAISNDGDLAFQRQYVRFETDGLLRSDAKTRAEVYETALDPLQGWMTRDEVRRLEDLEPEPAGADPIQVAIAQMTNGNAEVG